ALTIVLTLWSVLLNKIRKRRRVRRIAVAGSREETERIMELLNRIEPEVHLVGGVSVGQQPEATDHIGHIDQLDRIVTTHRLDEVIFSSDDLPFSEISIWMARLSPRVHFKISSSQSDTIVGSDSKKLAGDLYASEIRFAIASPLQRRNKRMFDLVLSGLVTLLFPLVLLQRGTRQLLHHVPRVLRGTHTWVSYDRGDIRLDEIPALRPGLFTPGGLGEGVILDPSERHMINYLYAREYRVWRDIEIILRSGTKARV
ncbi:MAG: hypothetical protein R3330_03900, partial [Saprospiraceae bacterium]|nr:hypothetical protein [Saprospiraceae bacterium]